MRREKTVVLMNKTEGHNKYYIVKPVVSESFKVRYGGIGSGGVTVIYKTNKKNPVTLINSKIATGYRKLNQTYDIGDLVTFRLKSEPGQVDGYISDICINGYSDVIEIRTRTEMYHVHISNILTRWEVDENNTAIFNLTMPDLIISRTEYLTVEGYLKE